jgi:hypothetical protein
MMDYKEMAEIVTREVDAILERKKIRAMRIKKVSLAVSGLCAAVIVGVGAWHFTSNMKKPDDSFNGSGIISETETTTSANAVTTAKVTTVTAATTETKAAKTTVKATTAITTSEVSKNTAGTASSVYVTPVRTSASATQQVSATEKTTVNTSTSIATSVTQTSTKAPQVQTTAVVTAATTTKDNGFVSTATYVVTTALPTVLTTTSAETKTTYVIGYEDIDKQEISKAVAAKKSEYESSLLKAELDAREIERLVTDYEQKLRIDMIREAYKEKAMEILEELRVDPETANFYNFTPNVSCPLTDEQYEKALNSPKVIRISIKQTG